ncbi:MAG TPA: hypothetical protein VFL07_12475 [Rudaea sp.]|nr:hypothetical protein [Rudaea sp.]HSC11112.1 hypothetical protein [Rhodanobacteraceae bacterium]
MTQTDRYLAISASAFAVVAVAHVVRAIEQWTIVIGPWPMPIALSWIAAVAAAGLSGWAFSLLAGRRR